MKLIWLSDLHLEFLQVREAANFIKGVAAENPDAVLVTGDISNARRIEQHLNMLAEFLPCPVYFELGNHDFYLGSFAQVDALVQDVRSHNPNLNELGHGEVIPLGTDSTLIGHRGWADGRAGLGGRSTVRLNDHEHIQDLREPDPHRLFALLNRLGDESADYISAIATQALKNAHHLFIATHVPPFIEASLYQNKPSDPNFAPHFVNVAMGRVILDIAQSHPDRSITVLCGHTHHRAIYSPTSNLKVEVAGAQYHRPQIASILTIP